MSRCYACSQENCGRKNCTCSCHEVTPRCEYCKDRGFYSCDLSGGENYCPCRMGQALQKKEETKMKDDHEDLKSSRRVKSKMTVQEETQERQNLTVKAMDVEIESRSSAMFALANRLANTGYGSRREQLDDGIKIGVMAADIMKLIAAREVITNDPFRKS